MTTGVVLVHGANHGPWCWERVRPLLESRGLRVATPDLYEGPNAADPAVTQRAVDELGQDGPVIVLGHSFGGYAITQLDPATVAHLVYLAAVLPDAGAWFDGLPTTDDFFELVTVADGVMVARPETLDRLWYGDCRDDIAWALARLRPHPMGAVPQLVAMPAWRAVPSTYVMCERDGSLSQRYMHAAAGRVGRSVTWPTSHSPMLSRPDLVADLLSGIAASL